MGALAQLRGATLPFLIGSALVHGSVVLCLAANARFAAPSVALEHGVATSRMRLVLRAARPLAELPLTTPAPPAPESLEPLVEWERPTRAREPNERLPAQNPASFRTNVTTLPAEVVPNPSMLDPFERAAAPEAPNELATPDARVPLELERSHAGYELVAHLALEDRSDDLQAADIDRGAVLSEPVPLATLNPRPEYPAAARARGIEGTVTLLVKVSRAGRALAVTIERSSGSELLDRAAQHAVERWRFTPALRGGAAADAEVRVPVTFRLRDERR